MKPLDPKNPQSQSMTFTGDLWINHRKVTEEECPHHFLSLRTWWIDEPGFVRIESEDGCIYNYKIEESPPDYKIYVIETEIELLAIQNKYDKVKH